MAEEATDAESVVVDETPPLEVSDDTGTAEDPESPGEEIEEDAADDAAEDTEEIAEEGEEEGEILSFNLGGNALEIPADAPASEVAEKLQEFSDKTWGEATKKNQANAEERKQIEKTQESLKARSEDLDKLRTLSDEQMNKFSKGLALKAQIEEFNGVDMTALYNQDPDQYRLASDRLAQLNSELQTVSGEVAQMEQASQEVKKGSIARLASEGKAMLEKRAPEVLEKRSEVVDYAIKQGISKAEAENLELSPIVAIAFHKAMQLDNARAAAKKPKSKRAVRPVKSMKTSGNAQAGKKSLVDLAKQEDNTAYVKRRMQQRAKQA